MKSNNKNIHVLSIQVGIHKYAYVYRDGQEAKIMAVFGRHASNANLNFSWACAASLAMRVRQIKEEIGNVRRFVSY